ncbi:hypothetical protein IAT38_001492 [Cryptococcus sp. DSM 104549]
MPLIHPPSSELRPSESDLTYIHAYNSIVSRARRTAGSGSGGVVVFVGVDVDGLLGARILCSMFKDDDVPYRLVPIGGYKELEQKRDEALASEELHTIVLLSLGNLLPLADYFVLPKTVHLHILDSHRPWNLDNLFGLDIVADDDDGDSGKIWVWGDGGEFTDAMDDLRKSYEALAYAPDSDSDSDSDSEDESEEDEADEEEPEEEDTEGSETEGSTEGAKKRRRKGSAEPKKKRQRDDDDRPRKLTRAARDAHDDRIRRYYDAGTSVGQSVALTIYLLATVLERADNDILWYSILSITHQYITSHIDREKYEEYHVLFLDEVVRLNHEMPDAGAARTANPDNRNIVKSEELRFVLLRHWDLYNAILHSSYVAGRLGIWREKGRDKLRGLFAKMGFAIKQSQQTWAHMDRNLKQELPEKLEEVGPEYGLVELSYPSFTRSYGLQLSTLSSADAVEVLSALLDIAVGLKIEVDREGGRGGGEWFGGMMRWSVGTREAETSGAVDEEERNGERGEGGEEGQEKKKEQDWHVTNFWIAYDACEDVALIRRSLPLAMALHRAIVRAGSDILDKSVIRTLKSFRLAIMSEGPDLRMFSHASTLSRLALWLVDATRDRWMERLNKKNERTGAKVKSLPFVVACLNEDKKTFLISGVTGAPEYGDVRKNKFGLAFQRAATECNAELNNDMFDTSVVEIAKDDLQSFIEELHLNSA